jgi:hypothetical protein
VVCWRPRPIGSLIFSPFISSNDFFCSAVSTPIAFASVMKAAPADHVV